MTIEWKEPPAAKNRKWTPIVDQLKSKPGSWASMGEMSISTAYTYAKRYGLELRLGEKVSTTKAEIFFRASEVK